MNIVVITDVSDQFRKLIMPYRRVVCGVSVMRQSACLVADLISLDDFAAHLGCTLVDRASDTMIAPTKGCSVWLERLLLGPSGLVRVWCANRTASLIFNC